MGPTDQLTRYIRDLALAQTAAALRPLLKTKVKFKHLIGKQNIT